MSKAAPAMAMDLVSAIESPLVFGTYFKDLSTWREMITLSKVLSGRRDLNEAEMELYRRRTGWPDLPAELIRELFLGGGRRIGKSTFSAIWAAYFGVFGDFNRYLAKGETARIWIIATNMQQGRIIKNYLTAIFRLTPFLAAQVKKERTDSIELKNGCVIEIKPSSWRTTRGYSCAILIMEELQSWRYEADASANIDSEVYGAIKPGMITIKNSLTIGIGTLFARAGLLYQKYASAHGRPGPTMFWGPVPTWEANLSITERDFESELRENLGDCAYFAEAGIAWREDIETYLSKEIVDRAVVPGRASLPYNSQHRYFAFCDSSELIRKGGDAMCLGISHNEDGKVVLDYLDEVRPPADPKMVIERFTAICREYHITKIIQDRVSLGWIASDFAPKDISVEACKEPKSVLYEHFAVMMNKGNVSLLDHPRLRAQIGNLEKRQLSGGVSKVDHISGAHDDLINVAAGACLMAARTDDYPVEAELFMEMLFKQSDQEEFDEYVRNFLLDIPQKPWSAKKNNEDDDE